MNRPSRAGLERSPGGWGAGHPSPRPPADALAERDRRMSYVETANMAVLGDPPPGRSALDGWVHRGDGGAGTRERW